MKPRLVYHSKDIDSHGNIVEITIWQVPVSRDKPHGLRYSLVYIADGKRIVGYDNAEGKGDHRHFNGREYPYLFASIEGLFEDFKKDIKRSERS